MHCNNAVSAIEKVSKALSYDESEDALAKGEKLDVVYRRATGKMRAVKGDDELPPTVRCPKSVLDKHVRDTVCPISGDTVLTNL